MNSLVMWLASLTFKDFITSLPGLIGFGLSMFTLWASQFRRGDLRMTRPTLICFKREWPRGDAKIFLRSLLFSTASRGRVVESMFLKVHHPHGVTVFDFWGHTDSGKLTLGSGLFVGQNGIACDHHFNPNGSAEDFQFWPGDYRIDVFVSLVLSTKPKYLVSLSVALTNDGSVEIEQFEDGAVYFRWNAEALKYDAELIRDGTALDHYNHLGKGWHR